jgi:hypothetical protein
MKSFCFSVAVFFASLCESAQAEKLTLAHVAINPGQGMLLLAKDSGLLALSSSRSMRQNRLAQSIM